MEFLQNLGFTHFDAIYVTPLYAGPSALLLVYLSAKVVRLRNRLQIRNGDGGHAELTAAVRAQSNLLEYLPTALLLLLMIEMLTFSQAIVHVLGIWFVLARLLYLKGSPEPAGASRLRRAGTRLTWAQIVVSSLLAILGGLGLVF